MDFWTILLIILVIAVAVMAVLYFMGRKMEKRQAEQQEAIEAAKQTVSILTIDKKRLKIKESGLPKMVIDQTPWYMRRARIGVVKAKVGPKIMTLIADDKVFLQLPLKTEAKVVISGIYITEIKSVREMCIRDRITPLYLIFLYLPQWHSQSLLGPKILSQNSPSFSGFNVL